MHLAEKRRKKSRLTNGQLTEGSSQAQLRIVHALKGIELSLASKDKLGVGSLVTGGVFNVNKVFVVGNTRIFRQLEQPCKSKMFNMKKYSFKHDLNQFRLTNKSRKNRRPKVGVLPGQHDGSLSEQLDHSNGANLPLGEATDFLNLQYDQSLADHAKHVVLNRVDDLLTASSGVLDGIEEQEHQEALDKLGSLGGCEPLEQQHENALGVLGHDLSREMLHD